MRAVDYEYTHQPTQDTTRSIMFRPKVLATPNIIIYYQPESHDHGVPGVERKAKGLHCNLEATCSRSSALAPLKFLADSTICELRETSRIPLRIQSKAKAKAREKHAFRKGVADHTSSTP